MRKLGYLLVLICLLMIVVRNESLSFLSEMLSHSRRVLQVVPLDTLVSISSTIVPADFSWTIENKATEFVTDTFTSPYSNCLELNGNGLNDQFASGEYTISSIDSYYDVSVSFYSKIRGFNGQDNCVIQVGSQIPTTLTTANIAFPGSPTTYALPDFQTSITIRAQLNEKSTSKYCYVCGLLVQGRERIPSAAPTEIPTTAIPTVSPTWQPTELPSENPTQIPTPLPGDPTFAPIENPT